TEKVARRGFDIYREYSVDPLEKCFVKDVFIKASEEEKLSLGGLVVFPDESCRVAAERMAKNEVTQLLVVSAVGHEILGTVRLTDLLKARRQSFYEEIERETLFPVMGSKA